MYSNFSALKTNMAIYLSPFQRHSTHLTATLLYTWLNIFFRGKNNNIPPPLSPVPTKLLLSTEHNVEALVLFVSPVVKKKNKPGKVNVVPTFLVKTRVPSLALDAGRKITTVFLVPGLEELVRKR